MKNIPDKRLVADLHFSDILDELNYWLEFDKKQTMRVLKRECRENGYEIKTENEFWQVFNNSAFDFGADIDEIILNTVNTMQENYNIDIYCY